MPTTKSFSLYLGKPDVKAFHQLLTDNARDLVTRGTGKKATSAAFGEGAELYSFPGHRAQPGWAKILSGTFTVPEDLKAQSPCAVLCFKASGRFFASTFSFGHMYLDDRLTEGDFGLRVTINALTDGKLKSVERANIGIAIRDFAQAPGPRDLQTFGFDDALDLIRKVSGRVTDDDFADTVSGSRPLRIAKKMELSDLPAAATTALDLFSSVVYRKTAFKIIDFLSPVSDIALSEKLDVKLVAAIVGGTDDFEIGVPEILPDDSATFRFEKIGASEFHADLSLDLYRDSLGDKLDDLTINDLGHHRIAAYRASEDRLIDDWPIKTALIGSLVHDGDRYALNEGQWYRLGRGFKKSADEKFKELELPLDKVFKGLKKVVEEKKRGKKPKISYQSEESYNEEIAKSSDLLLMDQRLVRIDEVPGPGIEVCDLLDIEKRRFIHVKKSSRQSSVLSHLFKQGSNAAKLFKQYEPFRAELIAVVQKHHGAAAARKLKSALDGKWTVEFRIADTPREDGNFNIPFFSKLSLKDEARSLQAMEFNVGVGFIKLAEAN
jgi:uncharacterized protein (TIGR04141 family)